MTDNSGYEPTISTDAITNVLLTELLAENEMLKEKVAKYESLPEQDLEPYKTLLERLKSRKLVLISGLVANMIQIINFQRDRINQISKEKGVNN